MPLTDLESLFLERLEALNKTIASLQIGLGSLHSSVDTLKQLADGGGGRLPLSDRIVRIENAISTLVGDGNRKPLADRVADAEKLLEELKEAQDLRSQEKAWFRRLVVSQAIQWLITGGGLLYIFNRGN